MFTVYINGTEVPGVHDFDGGKIMACLLHAQFEMGVDVVDIETGEIVFAVSEYGEVYESNPNVIEVFEFIIIEI